MKNEIYIGTAGWSIPAHLKDQFSPVGSHLERYAEVFNAVEINSSFYKDHKRETYAKWASAVPSKFRFSVKLSRTFIQEARLRETGQQFEQTLHDISGLEEKWGLLLIQSPPSLEFEFEVARKFLRTLRKHYQGDVAWEPRHLSWTTKQALELFLEFKINKVLADPEPCPTPKLLRPPLEQTRYLRLHGRPQIYKSSYTEPTIERIAESSLNPLYLTKDVWCIFDNTTFGHATENALLLKNKILNKQTSYLPKDSTLSAGHRPWGRSN